MGSQMGTPTVSRLYCTIPVFVKGTNLHRFGEDFFFFYDFFGRLFSPDFSNVCCITLFICRLILPVHERRVSYGVQKSRFKINGRFSRQTSTSDHVPAPNTREV